MTEDRYITIPRWHDFQHRDAGRTYAPAWIKVYTRLANDDNYLSLTATQRGILHGLWMLYAKGRGVLGETQARRLLALTSGEARWFGRHLRTIERAGFIKLTDSPENAVGTVTEQLHDTFIDNNKTVSSTPTEQDEPHNHAGLFPIPASTPASEPDSEPASLEVDVDKERSLEPQPGVTRHKVNNHDDGLAPLDFAGELARLTATVPERAEQDTPDPERDKRVSYNKNAIDDGTAAASPGEDDHVDARILGLISLGEDIDDTLEHVHAAPPIVERHPGESAGTYSPAGWREHRTGRVWPFTGCRFVSRNGVGCESYDPLGVDPLPRGWVFGPPSRVEVEAALSARRKEGVA